MNELLLALGLRLDFHETYIRLIRETIFVQESPHVSTSPGMLLASTSGIYQYQLGSIYPKTEIIWSYQTEFGEQLERYNAKQYQPYTLYPGIQSQQGLSGYSPYSSSQLTIGSGLTTSGAYGGIQQSQLSQSQQLQQAQGQQNIYSQHLAAGQFSLQGQSPQHSTIIKNIGDNEEPPKEFTLLSKIKKFFKWDS